MGKSSAALPDPAEPPVTRVPHVKGVAFRTVMKLVEERRGKAIVESAVKAMDGEVGAAFAGGTLVAMAWYPVAWYRSMWKGILSATGGQVSFVRELGRAAVDLDSKGIYRILFRLLSPQTLMSIGMTHFGRIYDTGKVEVLRESWGRVRVRWTGCAEFDHTMWVEIAGSCERLVELAGGKNVRISTTSGGRDGDDTCEIAAYWD